MDTGAIAIKLATDANLPIEQTQEVMEKINNLMELWRLVGWLWGTLMTLIFIPVGFVWLVKEESVVEED